MTEAAVENVSLSDVTRLEDIIDRDALVEVCRSFFNLFDVSIRVFSRGGALLADASEEHTLCQYVNGSPQGHTACETVVDTVKGLARENSTVVHACFTGAVYRIVPIDYQGRAVGSFVLGPYLPAEAREVPKSLLAVDPALEVEKARVHLAEMPRIRTEAAERIVSHLRSILDLMLFAGHRAYLTSEMHIATVRESFRELADKTAQLQQAYDRLRELDRLKSNFLATVSHELRTPLTSIIGYSEMLAAGIGGELSAEQKEFVDTIRSKGDHLLALITNLLDMSRLERDSVGLTLRPVDARALVEDVAATVAPHAHKKKISVDVSVESALPPLVGDVLRLRQILLNLADNAIKFTPEGGHVRFLVRAVPFDEESDDSTLGVVLMATPRSAVEIVVQDDGIGIPPTEQHRVFDAFYQVDGSSTRAYGGAGLGLSIVKRLVEAHGGTVRLESEPGRGTSFFVRIPEPGEDYAA